MNGLPSLAGKVVVVTGATQGIDIDTGVGFLHNLAVP
jgi:NAD(P)-dependent dehydrogenase (short-subunit alcohol dehydrogenase family)